MTKSKNPYFHRLQRLFKIINLIENKSNLTRKELAHCCGGVSVKTISRDIKALRNMGYEIVFDNNSGYQFLDRDFISVNRNFSALEALFLLLALRANTQLPSEFLNKLESKLLSMFPDSVKRTLNQLIDTSGVKVQNGRYTASLGTLRKLEQAVGETRKIEFDYRPAESDATPKHHRVVPYAIVWQRDRNYLIGDLEYRNYSPINYRLDRINQLRLTSDFGQVPKEFDLDDYLKNTWRMFSGEKQFVKIKFDPEAKHVFENRLGSQAEYNIQEKDGKFVFSGYIRGVEGLKSDLMGLGDQAKVIEPLELRQEIIECANKLIEKYEG